MRVAILPFGCRLNASESDGMAAALQAAGWELGEAAHADVVLVNSCTITHEADADVRAAVRRVHRANPRARVVVTGCWAQADPAAALQLPGVHAVWGNAAKVDVVDRMQRLIATPERTPDVVVSRLVRDRPLRVLPPRVDGRARALLAVQDGCDYRCSFCIVPRVRGPSRSLEQAEILARVDTLVDAGVAEIVMTGIHLGTWGRDLRPRKHITTLVEAILPRLGPARLRLSSIDPHEVDDALVELLAAHPQQLCRHLHLPVQSCDDGVLGAMRRAHRVRDFVDLVEHATARVPGLAISSDVIAGFPSEDEQAHGRTVEVLSRLPLAYLHVFPYSRRQGTDAASLPPIPAPELRRRAAELRRVSQAAAQRFRSSQEGAHFDVVAHLRADSGGRWWGRSDHDLHLELRGDADWSGRRWRVSLDPGGRTASLVQERNVVASSPPATDLGAS